MIKSVYQQLVKLADINYEIHMSIDDLAEYVGQGKNSMAVGTSLSLLSRGGCIERFDIPHKKIKGTRLLNPDLNPNMLPLDYNALTEKERRDREKLETVIRFATSVNCRQQWILNYFGEKDGDSCDICDHCKQSGSIARREPLPEELIIVQKALSGVARMSYKNSSGNWLPRFGRGKIIQMLLGSKEKDLLNAGLDKLSTYGMLKDLTKDYMNSLFKELERIGLLQVTTSNNLPLMTLTLNGTHVMQGKEMFAIVWPETKQWINAPSPKKTVVERTEDLSMDADLYEALRLERSRIAQEMGNPRLFMILSNKCLQYLASRKPRTAEEAQDIPGIGPVKTHTVLPKFLKVINLYLEKRVS